MPRQDSLLAQLQTAVELATAAGCYDAADWIKLRAHERGPVVISAEDLEDAQRDPRVARFLAQADAAYAESAPKRPCDRCGGEGYHITNPLWPSGTEPHRSPCDFCNATGIEPE